MWEFGEMHSIAQTQIIHPKLIAGGGLPLLDGFAGFLSASGTAGESWISKNADESVLGDQAGAPSVHLGPFEKRY